MKTKEEVQKQLLSNNEVINNLNKFIHNPIYGCIQKSLIESKSFIEHSNYVLIWVLDIEVRELNSKSKD